MNRSHFIKGAMLLIVACSVVGCKSKQEKAAPAPVGQQAAGEVKTVSGENAGATNAVSDQDRRDAEAAALRVIAQMEAGDFVSVYREADPSFQKIGAKEQFVTAFQKAALKTGPLKNPRQISFGRGPDNTKMMVYRLENDRFVTDRRISFVRAKDGRMVLFGLNQHDEPKGSKAAAKK
jgi:hypothetical protein